ncbi:hypothetical protein A2230_08250 [candidate division WOR-1 bacterium RIFOXYA2_FULL_36_21]|uniref:SGNH hydrolase-type esterase domain-containing protein n=1 Tax=candidate division WOR-1 bacterium RIFOXYB2_FULL_36_35 TaxID=1802578 RepID=A0A1F4S8D1_UNCSA|nr:MAG: hypothetical protein A2230_08250 [candidate division WOR-1 bacterium RIFOXYA2_FULL_36_21]OGC16647.1 MAG: hypothetical protein A2290_03465 [candidate division WOR-1 bacterium RIFOXYB2_FULL_36_35]
MVSIILLLIVLGEIVFRIVFKLKNRRFYEPVDKIEFNKSHFISHPYLPVAYKTNCTIPEEKVESPITHDKLIYPSMKTNSYGLLFDEKLVSKNNLIIFLGNCTFGTGYYYKEVFYSLPYYLNKKIGDNYTFIPVARGGWTSMDIIFYLYTTLVKLKPKAIVFGFGLNDLIPALAPEFKSDYSHLFRNLSESKLIRITRDILPKIKFWHLYEYLLDKYMGTGNINYDLNRLIRKSYPLFSNNFNLTVENQNIRSMIGICKEHNILPILTTYLYYVYDEIKNKPTYKKLKKGVLIENVNIRRTADKCHVPIIDIEKNFQFDREFFIDETHLSPDGMEKYSQIFIPKFKEIMENVSGKDFY